METRKFFATNNNTLYCNCPAPFVRRLGSRTLEFVKYEKGKSKKTVVEYDGNQSKVYCKECGKQITFSTNLIKMPMIYVVTPPT